MAYWQLIIIDYWSTVHYCSETTTCQWLSMEECQDRPTKERKWAFYWATWVGRFYNWHCQFLILRLFLYQLPFIFSLLYPASSHFLSQTVLCTCLFQVKDHFGAY
jgi:hypothetical protein